MDDYNSDDWDNTGTPNAGSWSFQPSVIRRTWTSSQQAPKPAPEEEEDSTGVERLNALMERPSSSLERLAVVTLQRAIQIVQQFEQAAGEGAPNPVVSLLNDGRINLEWQRDNRELFMDIDQTDTLDCLLVEDGSEHEGKHAQAALPELVRWLMGKAQRP